MRIISSYKDYYDITLREGVDLSCVFERKYEKGGTIALPYEWNAGRVEPSDHHFINPDDHQTTAYSVINTDKSGRYKCQTFFAPVIFCGKYYPRWVATAFDKNAPDDVCKFYANSKSGIVDQFNARFKIDPLKKSGRNKWSSIRNGNTGTLFTELPKVDWDAIHARENSPILAITLPVENVRWTGSYRSPSKNYIILKNPQLSQVQFQQVIDPWTAFQELSMYMSGIMANHGKPMVQLTDKDIHAKHGFDKWSFRKMPEN